MKIAMVVTVDVDPSTWDLEYHCGVGQPEIRADVVRYFQATIQSMVDTGSLTGAQLVTVRTKKR